MRAKDLIIEFKRYGIGPYIEVPCSILAPVISELEKDPACEVMNPVNEAVAMGLAAGSYLATKKVPVVLMQNSGLCNAMNAVTSLYQIYGIPVLFLISWRGEPGKGDAPEHDIMGTNLKKILRILEVPYKVLSRKNFKKEVRGIINTVKKTNHPAALLLRDGIMDGGKPRPSKTCCGLTKRDAIEIIVSLSDSRAYYVATNGFISRETFYALRRRGAEAAGLSFYMLGSMGHALSIGMGIARYSRSGRKIIILDGDGGCLMHLGSMASIDKIKDSRLVHVVLDDGFYASTGNQRTVSGNIDFCSVARGCGYKNTDTLNGKSDLRKRFPLILRQSGPTFVRVMVSKKTGRRTPRVSDAYSCEEIRGNFMSNAL